MSAKELRQKSAADLQKELLGLRREQFNLRMARATGQTAKPDQFSKVRRNIARLKTVQGEQRRSGQVQGQAQDQASVTAKTEAPAAKAKTAKVATKAKAKTTAKSKSKSA
jgi:large subunit ribosomal protein L29